MFEIVTMVQNLIVNVAQWTDPFLKIEKNVLFGMLRHFGIGCDCTDWCNNI